MKIPSMRTPVKLASMTKTFVIARKPELLFGVSIASTIGAVVLSAKGGYEARGVIDAHRAETGEEPTVQQMANLTWHCYLPAGLATVTSIGSTTGLHFVHISEKKQLAQLAMAAVDEIKAEAKRFETQHSMGKLTEEERTDIIEGREVVDGQPWIEHSDGEVEELYLVRDGLTGRDIFSNERKIEQAIFDTQCEFNAEGACDLEFFYSHAGFDVPPAMMEFGWGTNVPTIKWDETRRDDGRPVRRFTFRPQPEKGYDRSKA